MFDVADVIVNTIKNNGITPTDRIEGQDIIPKLQAISYAEFTEKVQKYNAMDNGQFKGLAILKEIITLAISSRTEYRLKGGGRPQLLNSEVISVSKGWKSDIRAWEEIQIIDAKYDGWTKMKMKDIYAKLGTDSHHDAIEFISLLVEHIFKVAGTNHPVEINASANANTANERREEHTENNGNNELDEDSIINLVDTDLDLSDDDDYADANVDIDENDDNDDDDAILLDESFVWP